MKKCSKSTHHALAELNITPLLDLAFVLLVIFIITTTPIVNDLEVDLPSAAYACLLSSSTTSAARHGNNPASRSHPQAYFGLRAHPILLRLSGNTVSSRCFAASGRAIEPERLCHPADGRHQPDISVLRLLLS